MLCILSLTANSRLSTPTWKASNADYPTQWSWEETRNPGEGKRWSWTEALRECHHWGWILASVEACEAWRDDFEVERSMSFGSILTSVEWRHPSIDRYLLKILKTLDMHQVSIHRLTPFWTFCKSDTRCKCQSTVHEHRSTPAKLWLTSSKVRCTKLIIYQKASKRQIQIGKKKKRIS